MEYGVSGVMMSGMHLGISHTRAGCMPPGAVRPEAAVAGCRPPAGQCSSVVLCRSLHAQLLLMLPVSPPR